MATYDPKQVLSDYANGRITPEMAAGHSLQHINLLYETQNTANAERHALRQEVSALQTALNRLQQVVERLVIHTGMPSSQPRNPKPAKPG